MKTISLSLSRAEATAKLENSLHKISDGAIKLFDESACYGDVYEEENETTFVIGFGPTGFTTAQGKISETSPEGSELSYKFKGLPWSFLISSINFCGQQLLWTAKDYENNLETSRSVCSTSEHETD